MSKSGNDSSGCAILIGVAAGIYVLYLLIVFSVKAFAYLGYNSAFYMDNLLYIKGVSPFVTWSILGLLVGSIIGVLVSAKKHNLSRALVLWPIGILLAFVVAMGFINKPSQHDGPFILPASGTADTSVSKTYNYYTVTSDVNVRSGPSVNNNVLFTLKRNMEVEVVERNFYDSKNSEWMKVNYNGQEGYVNAKFLTFSRTYPN
jgi:hypothetical protein